MPKKQLVFVLALVLAGVGSLFAATPDTQETPADAVPAAVSQAEIAPQAEAPQESAVAAAEVEVEAWEVSCVSEDSALLVPTAALTCIPCTIGQPPRCPNCGLGNPGVCNGTCCECLN